MMVHVRQQLVKRRKRARSLLTSPKSFCQGEFHIAITIHSCFSFEDDVEVDNVKFILPTVNRLTEFVIYVAFILFANTHFIAYYHRKKIRHVPSKRNANWNSLRQGALSIA